VIQYNSISNQIALYPKKGTNKAIAGWPCGKKWADYALFIGEELYGIVEAKAYFVGGALKEQNQYSSVYNA